LVRHKDNEQKLVWHISENDPLTHPA